jgi:hypothetical protein
MKTIQVYDPPMCCSTGVCGPQVDPVLPAFAGFLHQVKKRGCVVERYNLTQQPIAFLENPAVKSVLDGEGVDALPVILVDGHVVLKGRYPDETQRGAWLNALVTTE